MDKNLIVTIEQYINLLHRMTNYSEDVIKEYIKCLDINNIGDYTMLDIYNEKTMTKLFWIERGIKLKKLINLSK